MLAQKMENVNIIIPVHSKQKQVLWMTAIHHTAIGMMATFLNEMDTNLTIGMLFHTLHKLFMNYY